MGFKGTTLRKQFEAFDDGVYLDSDGSESNCYNFYDWFCKDSSLKNKANTLFKASRRFAKKLDIDLDTHYVFFKNNCPVNGPLYDDFRICDVKDGRVVYNVTPKSGHTGRAEVWGASNKFEEPLFQGDTLSEIYKEGGLEAC